MEFLRNLILFAPTILFCFILLWEILSGLRRGLRKSVILFINMALAFTISIIIFLIVFGGNLDTKMVSKANWVLGFSNTSLQELFDTPETYNTLSEYLYFYITDKFKDIVFSKPDLIASLSLALALAQSLVKAIGLIIVFIMYGFFKFIFYIVYLIFFKEGRRKKKMKADYENGVSSKSYKKRALFGGLVGALRGLVVGIVIFSFIGSFFFVFTDGRYSKEDETFITDDRYYINEIANMVNRYGTVGIGNILESAKNPNDVPFYLLIADALTVGNYEITGENPKEGSVYLRKELGPIVSMVKDAYLVALQYDVDLDRIGDSNYLADFLKKEVDGISFADRVDVIIDRYNFGEWTILLSQSLLNAVANSVEVDQNSTELGQQILYYVIAGDHAIKAEDLVTNENINTLLKFALCAVKNMDELEDFGNRFSSDTTQTLALGVKKSNSSLQDFSGVKETIRALDAVLNSLDGINNELITDIVILLIESNLPELSLDGVNKEDDKYSAYKIKWKEDVSDLLNIVCDVVDFIAQKNIYTVDDLIEQIVNGLDDENSVGSKLIDNLAKSDISGILLNANGFTTYVNDMLRDEGITFVSLPTDIVYGNYYDEDGAVVRGEICNLILTAKPKVKTVYNVIINSDTDAELLNGLISKENGLFDFVAEIIDDTGNNYSRLIHSIFSQALLNFDELNLDFRVVVDEKMVDAAGYINSQDLKDGISVLSEFIPYFLEENFDYKSFITVENIQKIKQCKLLFATGSVIIYDMLSQIDQIGKYIPSSYWLDTDENIKANLSKWTADDGELLTLVNAVIDCDLISVLFSDTGNINYADVIFNDVENFSTTLEHALDDSVLLNCILTGIVTEMDLGSFEIKIPTAAQANSIDGLKRIKGNQISGLIEICKELGLDEVIKNALAPEGEEINPDNIVSKILSSSNESIDKLFSNYVLNATVTGFLSAMLDDSSVISLIIPVECYDETVDAGEHLIVKSSEYDAFINVARNVFEVEDESGNKTYSYGNMNYNNILKYSTIDSILESKIFCATLSYFIVNKMPEYAGEFIVIPSNYIYSRDELVNSYSQTAWATTNEFKNVFYAICDLNIKFDENNSININAGELMTNLLSENTIDKVLSSNIIHLSISKIMIDNPQIKVVDAVTEYYAANEVWIKESELKEMVNTINAVIDIADFGNLESFDDIGSKIDVNNIVDNIISMEVEDVKESLGSIIIQSTISQTLLDNISTANVEYIKIPASISNEGIYSMIQMNEDGSMKTDDAELFKVLSALYALKLVSMLKGNIDASVVLDKVSSLNDQYDAQRTVLDVVADSKIIWYTLTNYITDGSKTSIDVPQAALYADGSDLYLNRQEIKALVNALNELEIDMSSSEDIDIDTVLSNANKNADAIANLVNDSYIIRYTITKVLEDYSSDENASFKFANAAKETNQDTNEVFISKAEATGLIRAIKRLGITSLESLDLEGFIHMNELASVINESYILKLSLTDKLLGSSSIVVPYYARTIIQDEVYIIDDEITNLIVGVQGIGMTEFDNIAVDDLLNVMNIDGFINSSYILRATIYDKLKSVESLSIPNIALEQLNSNEFDSTDIVLSTSEVTGLVSIITSLGITSFDSLEISTFLGRIVNGETLNQSDIIRYTITNAILKDSCPLKVPSAATAVEMDQTLLTKDEIVGLVGIIKALGLIDFNNFDANTMFGGTISAANLSAAINDSYVARYTITNKMNASTSPLNTPNIALETEYNQDFITKEEMIALVNVIKTLNISNFNDFNAQTILGGTLSNTVINDSYTVRYAISKQMLKDTCPLDIPTVAIETLDSQQFITKDEITGLIGVISSLDLDDFNDFNATAILDGVLSDSLINSSYSVRYTVTNKMNASTSTFKVPKNALEKISGDTFITEEEITNFMSSINGLSISSFESYDVNTFLSIDGMASKISQSLILRYSFTNSILGVDIFSFPKVAFEKLTASYNSDVETFIKENEITSLINALNAIGLDLSTVSIDLTRVSSSISTVLLSDILHITISDALFNAGSKLNEPDLDNRTNVLEDRLLDDSIHYTISKVEIATYFEVASSLGLESYGEDISFDNQSAQTVYSTIAKMINSQIIICSYSEIIIDWFEDRYIVCPTVCVYNVYISSNGQGTLNEKNIVDKTRIGSYIGL